MRRLLYLALVLVLLAVTGLAFVQVASSEAYVGRSRLSRIEEGMPFEEVRRVLADLPTSWTLSTQSGGYDRWTNQEGYCITVTYLAPQCDGAPELSKRRVENANITGPDIDPIGRVLDFLGYPTILRRADC